MLYVIIVLIVIVVLLTGVLFLTFSLLPQENLQEEIEDIDHVEYHKEKQKKIKDQYYRSVDLEKLHFHTAEDPKIVGIAKPQGRWTSMVIRRNMQYMMTIKNLMGSNFSKMGIWQLKIKAQSLISHGIHRGKGR